MAKIIWSEPSLTDLDAIADYVAVENPAAATTLVRRVVEHVEQLASHPKSGSTLPELLGSRYRQVVEPPCRVFYRFDELEEEVVILHVMRSEKRLRTRKLRRRK